MGRQYDNINANHAFVFRNYQALKKENGQLRKKVYYLNELAERYHEVINNSKAVLKTIREAFESVINTLADHIKCTSEYIREFLKHHGLKMVLGGVGGIGLSIIVGVVAAASPASIAILAMSGMMFGSGCGGLAGWSVDYWREKKSKSCATERAETVTSSQTKMRPTLFSPKQKNRQ